LSVRKFGLSESHPYGDSYTAPTAKLTSLVRHSTNFKKSFEKAELAKSQDTVSKINNTKSGPGGNNNASNVTIRKLIILAAMRPCSLARFGKA